MPMHADFPEDPHAIIPPDFRWYPGDETQHELYTSDGYAKLLPPLVYEVRRGVKAWRDARYAGASDTTRSLLRYWFDTEHLLPHSDGTATPFAYYFAQREAVESAVWLYEVEKARDPHSLIRYDSSGRVSMGMFDETWARYVMKLATGAGKTKVMSLLIAWCYFHRMYEPGSTLSANFLVIAPNIIVLDRLREDFDGLKVFHHDPVLPPNGYGGRDWRNDFQPSLHIQDDVRGVSETGNIFLTNVHRVADEPPPPSADDDNQLDFFAGRRPTGKTNESDVDLGRIIRDIDDLVIVVDEAHQFHDSNQTRFGYLQDIANRLKRKGSRLSVQLDVTATPKHQNGAIFVQTISDYPLVEAIHQRVVKTPVLPDEASRAKLEDRPSERYTERFEDFIRLGYLEWKKHYERLLATGKKSVLFVMTDDTKHCNEVGRFLEARYPELRGAVLTIHTNKTGEVSEAKNKEQELQALRDAAANIDDPASPYKAIVSVMMLKEGWDVQNVVSMVGLRSYSSERKLLPEQTLGRGLRLMYRGWGGEGGLPVDEKVSVVGTPPFMEFVESIRHEGVDLEYAPMGPTSEPRGPIVVEVDERDEKKDIEKLDIELPVLTPRLERSYKNLGRIDVAELPAAGLAVKEFSDEEQRHIVFKDINTEEESHTTVLDSAFTPMSQTAVGFFAHGIMGDLRLVGGFDTLFGKLKRFMETRLFECEVNLDGLNILRNLSEPEARRAIFETFKKAINDLTIEEAGSTRLKDSIKLRDTRPTVVSHQPSVRSDKTLFNCVVGDNDFERAFAKFLDGCEDIISFAKNTPRVNFRIEYRPTDGGISRYLPDWLVKRSPREIWIIETKGREDVDDPPKRERLAQWCRDASEAHVKVQYRSLFVREEDWERYRPRTFADLLHACGENGGGPSRPAFELRSPEEQRTAKLFNR